MSDTTKIPLYPRRVVRSLCTPAVTGQIVVRDTVSWSGVRGRLVIESKYLRTGLDFRDAYARKAIYTSDQFPEIRFEIDSLIGVRKSVRGDTIRATAAGHLEIRGVRIPVSVPARATREAGGLRVQGRTRVPAATLVDTFGVSSYALGLSVGLKSWKDLWMGMDVVLRPQAGTP
jgi:polyisoprenoid-binding protein YceI